MDPYSSGEELVIKTRKPYTITKQRERWTEEEHNRFLEALKLYGRAWQRIEEHIGTKTAVQIRSHAQKFFTKLEKEALIKGVPIGQALDIEIPPPRPKRKPINPYPRKTAAGTPTPIVGGKDGKLSAPDSSMCHSKKTLGQEKEPLLEKPGGDNKPDIAKENREEVISDVLTLFHEGPTSPSLRNRDSLPTQVAPQNSCTFREFVPIVKGGANRDDANKSYVTVESKSNQKPDKLDTKQSFQDASSCNSLDMGNSFPSKEKLTHGEKLDEPNQPDEVFTENDMQAVQSCPRHVPVHILDGSLGMNTNNTQDMTYHESIVHQIGGVQGHLNQFTHHASSNTSEHQSNPSRSSIHHMFPSFHPMMTSNCDSNDYRSCLHISSTFSSLIVSALLQNPAAHAAASFAASFWPYANFEAPADSSTGTPGGVPSRQINSVPSMAAIAAATVAAATAWWAAHGLLPLCSPFHTGFTCPTSSGTAIPMDACQTKVANNERKDGTPDPSLHVQQLVPGCSENLREQLSASKSPVLSSSDSEESDGMKVNTTVTVTDTEQAAIVTELIDSNTTKNRKQVDRSSCGSNTPSSSEVETDALEKIEKDKEDPKESHVNHSPTESGNRRVKNSSNANDPWKEVSEEGRIAFRALFSREVLPQSFSPPHDLNSKGKKNSEKGKLKGEQNEEDQNGLQLDLNDKSSITCSIHYGNKDKASSGGGNNNENHTLTMKLGEGKLKARRTGFKPYKRCSVEAKESRIGSTSCQDEEKGPKRLRLGGET